MYTDQKTKLVFLHSLPKSQCGTTWMCTLFEWCNPTTFGHLPAAGPRSSDAAAPVVGLPCFGSRLWPCRAYHSRTRSHIGGRSMNTLSFVCFVCWLKIKNIDKLSQQSNSSEQYQAHVAINSCMSSFKHVSWSGGPRMKTSPPGDWTSTALLKRLELHMNRLCPSMAWLNTSVQQVTLRVM